MVPRQATTVRVEPNILDSIASGALAVDLTNRILYINRVLAKRLKIEPKDWTGRPVVELAQRIEARYGSKGHLRTCLDCDPNDFSSRSADLDFHYGDQPISLREDSRPLRDSNGKIVGRVFLYHDMAREREIDRMKSEFIAVASHELRTPMTSIKGSVDLILSGYAGEISGDTQELLEIAQKNCDRLVRLINDILDLAKIEAGQMKLKMQPMDLTDAVERSLRGVKSLADQSEVSLKIERPENLPLVEVDKDRMEQVVTNLLSNAIKFSNPKGEVRVELSVVDGWMQCSVIDQGCGIPPDQLVNVFGKFQQVGDSPRKGGTGLGLAICQALVNEHRGRIWVESKPNEGSRFVFRLPVYSEASEAPPKSLS